MKTSFYFVLWIGAYILIDVFGTSIIQEHAFGAAFLFVIIMSTVCNKFMSKLIDAQHIREMLKMFEMCHNDECGKFARVFRNRLIFEIATFAYLAVALVCMIAYSYSDGLPWLPICVFGYAMYRTAKDVGMAYKWHSYVKRQNGIAFPDEELQTMYNQYVEMRHDATFEEICPQPGIKDKVFRAFNLVMAMLSTLIGCLFLLSCILLIGNGMYNAVGVMTDMMYGCLALMFGITDLVSACKGYLKLY